jgi:acyl-CoA hydrolase
VHIAVDVRTSHQLNQIDNLKVAEGLFVFVAIDDEGKSRPLPD